MKLPAVYRALCAAVVAGAALLANAAAPREVKIEAMQFGPATLEVRRGETVTWRNADIVPHTATAAGAFDSGNIAAGQSWSKKMDQPGEFDYVCSYHRGMKARLVVR